MGPLLQTRTAKASTTSLSDASLLETEQAAAWVLSRVGFGATVQDLDHANEVGIDAFLDEVFAIGQPDQDDDPWHDFDVPVLGASPRETVSVVEPWLDRMVDHDQPVKEWLGWFWHGHLVSSLGVVRSPLAMVNQIRLFRELGGGRLTALLGAVTIDTAMLGYLDGSSNTGSSPNENYSRELLELFALGLGTFSEADVQAGALALSGWRVRRRTGEVTFVPARHDDAPQTYLGVDGVHDVESVIDAVVSQPACAEFIVGSLAIAILGEASAPDAIVAESDQFRAEGLQVQALVRRLVERGLRQRETGKAPLIVTGPVQWMVATQRRLDARLGTRQRLGSLRSAGQTPMFPPNVSGWQGGSAWLTTSATAARLTMASALVGAASDTCEPMLAAQNRDLAELARTLGLPGGFSKSTASALSASGASGAQLVNLALCSPEAALS